MQIDATENKSTVKVVSSNPLSSKGKVKRTNNQPLANCDTEPRHKPTLGKMFSYLNKRSYLH